MFSDKRDLQLQKLKLQQNGDMMMGIFLKQFLNVFFLQYQPKIVLSYTILVKSKKYICIHIDQWNRSESSESTYVFMVN